ncbi:hypothetical protein SELMODRAFT_423945 [Selaginella moellendorffii]|uniref:Uncharacterized protein n=1 Tax=Selaginella moellendorffii TaxID=88036 RepID=D8SNB0_SELML|nr:hypothetical protein SELMODRAFT_423945 [Selaginella moellendorffii]
MEEAALELLRFYVSHFDLPTVRIAPVKKQNARRQEFIKWHSSAQSFRLMGLLPKEELPPDLRRFGFDTSPEAPPPTRAPRPVAPTCWGRSRPEYERLKAAYDTRVQAMEDMYRAARDAWDVQHRNRVRQQAVVSRFRALIESHRGAPQLHALGASFQHSGKVETRFDGLYVVVDGGERIGDINHQFYSLAMSKFEVGHLVKYPDYIREYPHGIP